MAGCGGLFLSEPQQGEIAGAMYGDMESVVLVPDTVHVNQPFPISIRTFFGCNVEPGRTETEATRLHATITPYMNWRYSLSCPDRGIGNDLRQIYIRFDHEGTGGITVVGRDRISWPPHEPPSDTVRIYRTVRWCAPNKRRVANQAAGRGSGQRYS